MRYAAISDVHGNYHALKAVIKDAKTRGVSEYILVGDYVEDFPYPNEVTEAVAGLPSKRVIAGNKEEYLINISKIPSEERTDKQFAPMYWSYDKLTDENREYLVNLPKRIDFEENGISFAVSHSSKDFLGLTESDIMRSSVFYAKMKESAFTHEEYLKMMEDYLRSDKEILERIHELSKGIYIFGHSHLQWHVEIDGRVLLNAGSCGMPLDFNTSVPYTIIDTDEAEGVEGVKIEEIRVSYDLNEAKEGLLGSSLYTVAETWSDVIVEHLMTAEEKIHFLLKTVGETAKKRGDTSSPVSNETWEAAEESWKNGGRAAYIK